MEKENEEEKESEGEDENTRENEKTNEEENEPAGVLSPERLAHLLQAAFDWDKPGLHDLSTALCLARAASSSALPPEAPGRFSPDSPLPPSSAPSPLYYTEPLMSPMSSFTFVGIG